MFIVVLGMQGSGKGTQSDLLAKKLSLPHLSTGDLCRAVAKQDTAFGKHVKELIEGGALVPDSDITQILKQELPHECILDGYPRTLNQARILDGLAAVDVVISIDLGEEEATRRMLKRGRQDDTPEIIHKRIAQYHADADKITDYYAKQGKLRTVNGEQTIEQVFAAVCEELGI